MVKERSNGPKPDADRRCTCGICSGPVYVDEPGSRCPDCWATLRSIEQAHRSGAIETRGIPWDELRADSVRPVPMPPPVLYGLLTEDDVSELQRRRLKLGLLRLASDVALPQ